MLKQTFVLYPPDLTKAKELVEGVADVARRTGSPLLESSIEELPDPEPQEEA